MWRLSIDRPGDVLQLQSEMESRQDTFDLVKESYHRSAKSICLYVMINWPSTVPVRALPTAR